MAQHHPGLIRGDVGIGLIDRLLQAVVLVILFGGYLSWLGRSPVPAAAFAAVVLLLTFAWLRAPWAVVGRRGATTAGSLRTQFGDLDLLTCREFQQLVARLMDRDHFADVRALGLRDDSNTDVVGRTPTGRTVFVQCHRDAPRRRLRPGDVERSLRTAHDEHGADLAVLVTTGRFTRSALAHAERGDLVLLDRRQVAAWMAGRATPLTPYAR